MRRTAAAPAAAEAAAHSPAMVHVPATRWRHAASILVALLSFATAARCSFGYALQAAGVQVQAPRQRASLLASRPLAGRWAPHSDVSDAGHEVHAAPIEGYGGAGGPSALSCPVLQSVQACSRMSTDRARCAALASLRFQAAAGEEALPPLDARALVKRLEGGRRILFVGDSLVLQHWTSLVCLVHAAGVRLANVTLTWQSEDVCRGPQCAPKCTWRADGDDSRVQHACAVQFGQHSTIRADLPVRVELEVRSKKRRDVAMLHLRGWRALCASGTRKRNADRAASIEGGGVLEYKMWQKFPGPKAVEAVLASLGATDVAVFNFGLWYNTGDRADYARALRRFAGGVASARAKLGAEGMPRILWRESSPQFFEARGGLWDPSGGKMQGCSPHTVAESQTAGNFRNLEANAVMGAASIEVLRVWLPSLETYATDRAPMVPGGPTRADMGDCAHFYLPGVVDLWSQMLVGWVTASPIL